jgi:hypothetical protein
MKATYAVNELNGNLTNLGNYSLYKKNRLILITKKTDVHRGDGGGCIGSLWGGSDGFNKKYYEILCTFEQFNQCVDEMATNFGTSETYSDYKANYTAINNDMTPTLKVGGNYEFSDNGKDWEAGTLNNTANDQFQSKSGNKTEWYTYIREVKPVTVPAFTQEMADAGTFPSVGMEFISTEFGEERHSIVRAITNEYIIYICADTKHSGECCIEICANHHHPVTPPIELIAGKAYQFDYGSNVTCGIYCNEDDHFYNQNEDISADLCTNIQLLGVTS